MPTFETPPDWWIGLANLTLWAYWPAWAAVFTFLALLNTARLANRSTRREERRDVVFVLVAIRKLETALITFTVFVRNVDSGPPKPSQVLHVTQYNRDRGYLTDALSIPAEKFPTIPIYEAFGSAVHALQRMTSLFDLHTEAGGMPTIGDICQYSRDCEGALAELRLYARRLSTANEWAALHHLPPPHSLAGFSRSLKALAEGLRRNWG